MQKGAKAMKRTTWKSPLVDVNIIRYPLKEFGVLIMRRKPKGRKRMMQQEWEHHRTLDSHGREGAA